MQPAEDTSALTVQKLQDYWGTLPRSMFTLLESISGGISWHEVVMPLTTVGWPYLALFTLFIMSFVFAILNVMTAVFCQSAIESAQQDKELATLNQLRDQDKIYAKLNELFEEIDQDESGLVTLDELEHVLAQRHSQAYLQTLGISIHDAWTLIKLLDSDNSGAVDSEEFIAGCVGLMGDAKAVHVATLAYDQRVTSSMLEEFMESADKHLSLLVRAAKHAPAPEGRPGSD